MNISVLATDKYYTKKKKKSLGYYSWTYGN